MKKLPKLVKLSLEKARESALLAVEIYNKPATKFKSAGYIVLMIIAWTGLLHAIFYKNKKKPFYKKGGRFLKVDGDKKHWELTTCLDKYYQSDSENPVKKNLDFFISLRNKIEHRYLPQIDASVFAECQAMLLNFDEMLGKEFGQEHRIRESLSFSLQIFPPEEDLAKSIKHNFPLKDVKEFIDNYRSSISTDVLQSGKYAFKAFLIQVANHQSKESLPIQFVHYDHLSNEQKEQLSRVVAMIKYKEVPVSSADKFTVGTVVEMVQDRLGNLKIKRGRKEKDKFNFGIHTLCWKKYKVRPDGKSKTPKHTNSKFCVYDVAHEDYLYTQTWIDFLVENLKDKDDFASFLRS